MTAITQDPNEQTVHRYFELIRELRAGQRDSVDQLADLWDPEGVFEFSGPPPLGGAFHGAAAIRTLYLNRLRANGMPMRLETVRGQPDDVVLGLVETHVGNVRAAGGKVLAGWHTAVTAGSHGFDVPGSHEFVFGDDGKIKRLRVTVSHKPAASRLAGISMDSLTVKDLGKLSAAAWMVV